MGERRRPLVDIRATVSLVGSILRYVSFAFVVPAAVAVVYEESIVPFAVALAAGLATGLALERVGGRPEEVGVREGFLVVTVAWAAVAGLGAVPYLLADSPQLHNVVDAYFESMSGFTTTGASVLTDIEAMPKSVLWWRGQTQWMGGMGIVVLALAILPRLSVGGQQLMQNEAPGPEVDRLAPHIRETARRLWLLYVGLSAAMVVMLTFIGYAGHGRGMDLFEAVTHTFSTMSTGGFSPIARSLEPFDAATQWTVVAFMVIAGANFGLMWRALRGKPDLLPRDQELRAYLLVMAVASAIVAVELFRTESRGVEETIRHAVFQVSTVMTTTGYASVDFSLWTPLALAVLVLLMFIGGCSGSTAGAIKVMRLILVGRLFRREIALTVHPQAIIPVRMNGRVVDESALRAVAVFVLVYVLVFTIGFVVLLVEASRTGLDLSTFEAISASATTLGNVGPGVGFLGPMGSFDAFSMPSKIVMTVLMWVGRLEIIPVFVLLSRTYWRP